ncbi:ribonuclease P protein subunit p40 isoform X2 [Gouania willdenowi]|uniref:ribonuclease P protein subunit p40 isoform X2 n=1 Tax=Gouania willdenowi TaxID=441366 RepID=UPI00105544CD|nr:ribonuclease P protein subunit p40 isoform X2 [Gouania willdenowi]
MSEELTQTPRHLLVCERSSFQDEKNRLSTQVEMLHFNYKVSVLLPECSSAPSQLDSVLNSFTSFYLIKNLPVHELLDQHFLQTAVFQVVSVDLTSSCMAPGGSGYLRLVSGLKSRLNLQMDFLLLHHPGGGASLQSLLSRYASSEHRPTISQCRLSDLSCPVLESCDPSDAHSLLEWLGAVDADISWDSSCDFVSTLVCPEPKMTLSSALRVSVCGFLTPQDIQRLISELRCYLEQSRLGSWVSLTVHGFVDSPVSWGANEHGVLKGGENLYTLLMHHDGTYHLHLATGAYDSCPP